MLVRGSTHSDSSNFHGGCTTSSLSAPAELDAMVVLLLKMISDLMMISFSWEYFAERDIHITNFKKKIAYLQSATLFAGDIVA